MNIVWKRPDGGVSVTHLTDEGFEALRLLAVMHGAIGEDDTLDIGQACHAHAIELQDRGDIPADYEVVAIAIDLPGDRVWRDAWTWTTPDPIIDICPIKARQVTKERLRAERLPLFETLDKQFLRNLESGADNTAVIAEKKRLRDLPEQVDAVVDSPDVLDQLKALSV